MKYYKTIQHALLTIALCVVVMISCSEDGGSDFSYSDSASMAMGGSMARFTINGDYLYTVDNQTLKTFKLSDPEKPEYLDKKDQYMSFGIETIFSKDTLLFIGSQDGMYIYNVTRPEYPQQMSMTRHIRSCDPVVAKGNYAYVTLNSENTWCGNTSNQLEVYDISDPNNPTLVKTEIGFIHPRGLGIDGTKMFICDNGVKVYDITNPQKPIWVDDFSHIPEAKNIDAYDVIPLNGLLLMTGANGIYQFDYKGEKLAFVSKIEINRE